ncbi:hypothetical protein Ga0061069_10699 [Thiomonas bhubaneswarensis]|uniref:Membrane-bound lysozyme-inhibitor of c-type lysozyme n=2 Tax=Thiomonas bhubaneswarensis TaxID=339866 RepID=A0A0K6I403_9BURK|nr:hypothetical protein Ga0061069_10699 [Thiomonas bhubaneswarensis]
MKRNVSLGLSVLSGLVGLSCMLSLPAHAQSSADKSQQPGSAASAKNTEPTAAPTVVATAATATPALLKPSAAPEGTENGYPDVNPVFALKEGRMVCGNRRIPMDVKVEGANDKAVLLTWNKKHYVLKRKPTSTGAYHFDDAKAGFVLIQIPTKSMLFDKKNMTRLADDCVPIQ